MHINFISNSQKQNKMTSLQFNAKQFFIENEDLFYDSYLNSNSKWITRILEHEELFIRLCIYLKKGNLIDFRYLEQCFNEALVDFKKDIQQYFA